MIMVADPDTNPAFITKVATADTMTIYPGASESTEIFSIANYTTQMALYKNLLNQLIEGADQAQRENIRGTLRIAFKRQLENMANVERRLPDAKSEDVAAARRLAKEVLQLYGLLPPDSPPVVIIEQCPPQRCRLFSGLFCRR